MKHHTGACQICRQVERARPSVAEVLGRSAASSNNSWHAYTYTHIEQGFPSPACVPAWGRTRPTGAAGAAPSPAWSSVGNRKDMGP
eukprot:1152021-Pelagomonas_calceolata.AAC.10